MSLSEYRDMTERERALLRELLAPAFPGREQVETQIATAQVKVLDADGSLEFLISSGLGADDVKYAVPTEAEYEDADGTTVHVLLHMTGNIAKELEFYREDNAQVQTWPIPDKLRVFAPK